MNIPLVLEDWYYYTQSPLFWHLVCPKNEVEKLSQPYYRYVSEASPHLKGDTIRAHCLSSFPPFQSLLDLRLLDSPHKMTAGINKGVVEFNGRALGLSIEQLVNVLPPSMLNLLVLHQDAFDLVNIPHLPLSNLGHLIDIPFAFIRV
jgi:hypothetical protein